jgi:hypothetical protein
VTDVTTDAFTKASGGTSASFTEKGKWVSGKITAVGEKQETAFGTGDPVVWKDGSPKMQMVVTVQTDETDPTIEDDDGTRVIYCKWGMTVAIGDAIRETGYQGPMVGGKLGLCWSGDKDTGKGNPLKLWKAAFEPPAETGAFLGEPPVEDDDSPERPF